MIAARSRLAAGVPLATLAGPACFFGGHSAGDTSTLLVGELTGRAVVRLNGIENELKKDAHVASGAVIRLFPSKGASLTLKRGTKSSISFRPYDSAVAE